MNIRTTAAVLAGTAALAVAPAASAHITLNPKTAAAGGFTELLVRVPNEQDKAATTKVDLKLPPGFVFASYEARPGWTVKVTKTKLAKPLKTDDGEVTEQVSEIVWTAGGKKDGIQPGQFADFPLSVQIPGKEGDTLTFKAIQTYDNGEIVRWIGAPDSDTPAPQVSVTAEQKEGAAPAHQAAATPAAASDSGSSGGGSSDDSSDTLSIIALIVGGLGLAVGGAALVRSRKAGVA